MHRVAHVDATVAAVVMVVMVVCCGCVLRWHFPGYAAAVDSHIVVAHRAYYVCVCVYVCLIGHKMCVCAPFVVAAAAVVACAAHINNNIFTFARW